MIQKKKRIIPNEDIKLKYASKYPYSEYIKNIIKLSDDSFSIIPNIDDDRFNDLCTFLNIQMKILTMQLYIR